MTIHREIEKKILLSKEEYDRCLHSLKNPKIVNQLNIYYDTVPSLKERGMSVRFRLIEDSVLFTLKIKTRYGNDEVEFPIESLDLNDNAVVKVLNNYQIDSLHEVGRLFTNRQFVHFRYGDLCLDHSTYNGKEDYEIEFELHDPDNVQFDEFYDYLQRMNIEKNFNTVGKITRCLKSI